MPTVESQLSGQSCHRRPANLLVVLAGAALQVHPLIGVLHLLAALRPVMPQPYLTPGSKSPRLLGFPARMRRNRESVTLPSVIE